MTIIEAPDQGEPDVVVHGVLDTSHSGPTRLVRAAVYGAVGLIALLALGLTVGAGQARLGIGSGSDAHVLALSGKVVVLTLGAVILALAGYQAWQGFGRRATPYVAGVVALLFLVAFLAWVSLHGIKATVDVQGLLQNAIGLSVPLVLGAMAGVMCERSGVINVAIEGQMLAGAWAAAFVGTLAGSWFGLVGGVAAGAVMGLLLALFAIKFMVNQVVLGVVLNVLAAGLTGFFFDAFMANDATRYNQPDLLREWDVPGLSHIPFLGPLLFSANAVVYLTYVVIIAVDVILFRTRWGLRTRAVGEHPRAADTVGIRVLALRYRNVLVGSAIAGLGGAYFTIGSVGAFSKNITSGNGFIALAAVIFGRWSPRGATAAALLFGFASALNTRLSILLPSAPTDLLAMLPYVATIVAVAGLVGKVRAPGADGEPYVKQ
ncbi:ABC transporter permease [Nocardioides sp. DS6]|uniref:ABC transporter permease n=1 Tax=Nocardioides eburneus TaxID=3231482 RepID=A0ABV3T0W8_9ACTN